MWVDILLCLEPCLCLQSMSIPMFSWNIQEKGGENAAVLLMWINRDNDYKERNNF